MRRVCDAPMRGAAAVAALVLAVLVAITLPPSAAGSPSAGPVAANPSAGDVDRYVSDQMDRLPWPGLAVTVLRDGRPLLSKGYGVAGPDGTPVTPRTPFVLGSTSKQFTALAVQQLIAQNRISLDMRAHEVLPWFGTGSDRLSRITVRQLLSHTSGLSQSSGLAQAGWRLGRAGSIQEATRALREHDVISDPGARFEYSNANYGVLGSMIEAVTGQPFAVALRALVFEPLALSGTTADPAAPGMTPAAGYYPWLGRFPVVTPAPRLTYATPSATIVSTADDLTRVLQAHLDAGSVSAEGTLRRALAASEVPLAEQNEYASYASGWNVRRLWELHDRNENPKDPGLPMCLEHNGSTDRSRSYLLVCPTTGLAVVALTNSAEGPDPSRWWGLYSGLVHATLGTRPAEDGGSLLIRSAPVILVALPLAQVVGLVLQVRGLRKPRRRRRVWAGSGIALLAGIPAAYLGYVVAPKVSGQVPLHQLWSAVPDLGVSTLISTALLTASIVLVLQAFRRARRRSRSGAALVEQGA